MININTVEPGLVIRVSWKTEVMPVPAHFYSHSRCYSVQVVWPHQQVATVPVREISPEAVCMMCGAKIREEGEKE